MVSWFMPIVPESRIAVLRTVLYLFVIIDIHLFVRDPIPLSRNPELYQPLLIERLFRLPPPSVPLTITLYLILMVGCLVAAANVLPRLAGGVVAAAFTWWTAIGMSYGRSTMIISHSSLRCGCCRRSVSSRTGGAAWNAQRRPDGRSSASRSRSSSLTSCPRSPRSAVAAGASPAGPTVRSCSGRSFGGLTGWASSCCLSGAAPRHAVVLLHCRANGCRGLVAAGRACLRRRCSGWVSTFPPWRSCTFISRQRRFAGSPLRPLEALAPWLRRVKARRRERAGGRSAGHPVSVLRDHAVDGGG